MNARIAAKIAGSTRQKRKRGRPRREEVRAMGRMPTELELDLLYEQEAVGYYYGLRVPFRSSLCGFPAVWEEPPCEAIESPKSETMIIVRKQTSRDLRMVRQRVRGPEGPEILFSISCVTVHGSAQDANRMPVVSRRLQGSKRSGVLLSSPRGSL
jgi:hypothetical protein